MTLHQRLAAGALVLGAVAIFAQPMRGTVARLDTRALAGEMQRDADRVAPLDLADWIVRGRADIRLIDVRDPAAFATYHIPGAENLPIGALAEASLPRTDTIVICAEEGSRAAQAWFLLKALGYRSVVMLEDGLDGWRNEVLFPVLSDGSRPYLAQRDARASGLAKHFGGEPRQAGSEGAAAPMAVAMPPAPVDPPVMTGAAPGGGVKKKRKEGC